MMISCRYVMNFACVNQCRTGSAQSGVLLCEQGLYTSADASYFKDNLKALVPYSQYRASRRVG